MLQQQPSVTMLSPGQQQQQLPGTISQLQTSYSNNNNNNVMLYSNVHPTHLLTSTTPSQTGSVISSQQPFTSSPTPLLSTPHPPAITQQHPPTLTSHSLPTPPDIIAQKRKRPSGLGTTCKTDLIG